MSFTISKHIKRKQLISNAVLMYTLEKSSWFNEIKQAVSFELNNQSYDKSLNIILKWVKACEEIGSDIVKNEILNRFNNGNF